MDGTVFAMTFDDNHVEQACREVVARTNLAKPMVLLPELFLKFLWNRRRVAPVQQIGSEVAVILAKQVPCRTQVLSHTPFDRTDIRETRRVHHGHELIDAVLSKIRCQFTARRKRTRWGAWDDRYRGSPVLFRTQSRSFRSTSTVLPVQPVRLPGIPERHGRVVMRLS